MKLETSPKPCVFLDRDGTISEEMGYINHPDRIHLLPGAASAIRRLNEADILAIVVTNQSGVARGYFSIEVLEETMDRLCRLLAAEGARLDAIYHAPYHPSSADPRWRDDPDQMRKPGLGMLHKAQSEFSIDMQRAWVVGDSLRDVALAHRAGIPGILVKTGYGLGEYTYKREEWTDPPDRIAEALPDAVDWISQRLSA